MPPAHDVLPAFAGIRASYGTNLINHPGNGDLALVANNGIEADGTYDNAIELVGIQAKVLQGMKKLVPHDPAIPHKPTHDSDPGAIVSGEFYAPGGSWVFDDMHRIPFVEFGVTNTLIVWADYKTEYYRLAAAHFVPVSATVTVVFEVPGQPMNVCPVINGVTVIAYNTDDFATRVWTGQVPGTQTLYVKVEQKNDPSDFQSEFRVLFGCAGTPNYDHDTGWATPNAMAGNFDVNWYDVTATNCCAHKVNVMLLSSA